MYIYMLVFTNYTLLYQHHHRSYIKRFYTEIKADLLENFIYIQYL